MYGISPYIWTTIDMEHMGYPLVIQQFAIENGPVEIVSLHINSIVDLSTVIFI